MPPVEEAFQRLWQAMRLGAAPGKLITVWWPIDRSAVMAWPSDEAAALHNFLLPYKGPRPMVYTSVNTPWREVLQAHPGLRYSWCQGCWTSQLQWSRTSCPCGAGSFGALAAGT